MSSVHMTKGKLSNLVEFAFKQPTLLAFNIMCNRIQLALTPHNIIPSV